MSNSAEFCYWPCFIYAANEFMHLHLLIVAGVGWHICHCKVASHQQLDAVYKSYYAQSDHVFFSCIFRTLIYTSLTERAFPIKISNYLSVYVFSG